MMYRKCLGLLLSLCAVCCHHEEKAESQVNAYVKPETRLWPYGVVPYRYEKNLGKALQALFEEAVAELHEHTGVLFLPVEDMQAYGLWKPKKIFLSVKKMGVASLGGKATVGYHPSLGGEMELYDRSTLSAIRHELMHVLGFSHEHTHPEFTGVNFAVIRSSSESDFDFTSRSSKESRFQKASDENQLDSKPDVNSVMMYASLTDSSICFAPEGKGLDEKWRNFSLPGMPPRECILRYKKGERPMVTQAWMTKCARKCATHLDFNGSLIEESQEFSAQDYAAINTLYRQDIKKREEKYPYL